MDDQHCGLINTTMVMEQLHTKHARLHYGHTERLICSHCWLTRHPGAKVKYGLGVIQGGLENDQPAANEGSDSK